MYTVVKTSHFVLLCISCFAFINAALVLKKMKVSDLTHPPENETLRNRAQECYREERSSIGCRGVKLVLKLDREH